MGLRGSAAWIRATMPSVAPPYTTSPARPTGRAGLGYETTYPIACAVPGPSLEGPPEPLAVLGPVAGSVAATAATGVASGTDSGFGTPVKVNFTSSPLPSVSTITI